jgi:hypothetical protein
MTNAPLPVVCESRDRPEIEITPPMVEAGFEVLCNSGIADDYLKADKLVVVEIFEAMMRVYGQEHREPLT